jgi:hypothetical protein
VDTKFPKYRDRGDLEIWRIHPFDRVVTAWRREADGSYSEATYRDGKVALRALPEVVIDIDDLFAAV